jgi:hypothetical protein
MITRKVNSQGFELDCKVPETNEEYNGLAPKRNNAVLEDAINNTLYRGVFAEFRPALLEKLESVTGVKRINSGTEDDPVWESDGKFMKRLVATVATQRGMDPNAKATKDSLIGEWTPIAQAILDGIKFDPSTREPSTQAPGLAKRYLGWAKDAVKADGGSKLATILGKLLNVSITLPDIGSTGDVDKDQESRVKTLAGYIAQNEKRKRDIQDAQAKAEYGLEEQVA